MHNKTKPCIIANHFSGPGIAVGPVSVYVCVQLNLNDLWSSYLWAVVGYRLLLSLPVKEFMKSVKSW